MSFVLISLFCFVILFNPYVSILPKWLHPQYYFLFCSVLFFLKHPLKKHYIHFDRFFFHLAIGLFIGILPIVIMFFLSDQSHKLIAIQDAWHMLLLAPISEEIYFRSIVFISLTQSFKWYLAMILSAFLFSLTHSYIVGPMILGLLTAALAWHTKSIWPCVIVHTSSNLYIPIFKQWF